MERGRETRRRAEWEERQRSGYKFVRVGQRDQRTRPTAHHARTCFPTFVGCEDGVLLPN
jgi:hypothetical protein